MRRLVNNNIVPIIAVIGGVIVCGLLAAGCGGTSKGAKQILRDQSTASQQQEIYASAQPVPIFEWSQTRATLSAVLQAKASTVATWSVFKAFDGTATFVCPSVGYPIPADTQLTAPEQLVRIEIKEGVFIEGVVSQPEPDGVYSTGHSAGTYVACVRPNGEVTVAYSEAVVEAFPFEVRIVDGKVVDLGGASSFTVERRR